VAFISAFFLESSVTEFQISSSGEITVAPSATFDYTTRQTHIFTVKVTDGSVDNSCFGTASVTVYVRTGKYYLTSFLLKYIIVSVNVKMHIFQLRIVQHIQMESYCQRIFDLSREMTRIKSSRSNHWTHISMFKT